MIKKYKRKHSGYMRRSSRIYFTDLNIGKEEVIKDFLQLYANIVRYYIEVFWSSKNLNNQLANKSITDKAVSKFSITARLSQLAAKQAKEIVASQRKKSKRKQVMPGFRNITANIDSRFFTLSNFDGAFDWALTFSSGLPKITVPFNNTEHFLKFYKTGWSLGNSVRLGLRKNKIFIDLLFERPKPVLKTEGETVGLDLGYRVPLALSDGSLIGKELKENIEKTGKEEKGFIPTFTLN